VLTNLPTLPSSSLEKTKLYFDQYGSTPESYNSNDVSATISFFTSRGYTEDSAIPVAMTLLKQAKAEQQSIFKILDTLKGFTTLQISSVVATILNDNRSNSSTLGYKQENVKSIVINNIRA